MESREHRGRAPAASAKKYLDRGLNKGGAAIRGYPSILAIENRGGLRNDTSMSVARDMVVERGRGGRLGGEVYYQESAQLRSATMQHNHLFFLYLRLSVRAC